MASTIYSKTNQASLGNATVTVHSTSRIISANVEALPVEEGSRYRLEVSNVSCEELGDYTETSAIYNRDRGNNPWEMAMVNNDHYEFDISNARWGSVEPISVRLLLETPISATTTITTTDSSTTTESSSDTTAAEAESSSDTTAAETESSSDTTTAATEPTSDTTTAETPPTTVFTTTEYGCGDLYKPASELFGTFVGTVGAAMPWQVSPLRIISSVLARYNGKMMKVTMRMVASIAKFAEIEIAIMRETHLGILESSDCELLQSDLYTPKQASVITKSVLLHAESYQWMAEKGNAH